MSELVKVLNENADVQLPARQRRASVKENINPKILKRMQELGIKSIPQLSKRCGIAAHALYKCLGGRNEMTFKTAVRVAQGLNWTMEYLAAIYLNENVHEKIDHMAKNSSTLSSCEATADISQLNVKSTEKLCIFYEFVA